jgi:hypothetical protein
VQIQVSEPAENTQIQIADLNGKIADLQRQLNARKEVVETVRVQQAPPTPTPVIMGPPPTIYVSVAPSYYRPAEVRYCTPRQYTRHW